MKVIEAETQSQNPQHNMFLIEGVQEANECTIGE